MRWSNDTTQWRPWFAWRPIRLGPWKERKGGDLVWLEWVERRSYYISHWTYTEYRTLTVPDTTGVCGALYSPHYPQFPCQLPRGHTGDHEVGPLRWLPSVVK